MAPFSASPNWSRDWNYLDAEIVGADVVAPDGILAERCDEILDARHVLPRTAAGTAVGRPFACSTIGSPGRSAPVPRFATDRVAPAARRSARYRLRGQKLGSSSSAPCLVRRELSDRIARTAKSSSRLAAPGCLRRASWARACQRCVRDSLRRARPRLKFGIEKAQIEHRIVRHERGIAEKVDERVHSVGEKRLVLKKVDRQPVNL